MTSETERLRAMLDERGAEHYDRCDVTEWVGSDGEICHTSAIYSNRATVLVLRKCTTPEQAIAATLGDSVATGERQGVAKVYLVEVSDELIESWHPLGVYLHKESAEDCAEAYRREEDGVRQFARVIELKVMDE